jgi:N-methylhydantoinase B/oxoprolinase/acetone carboxylase alpha subunit
VLDVRSGGGGGFGNPAERSAEARARDRQVGFASGRDDIAVVGESH